MRRSVRSGLIALAGLVGLLGVEIRVSAAEQPPVDKKIAVRRSVTELLRQEVSLEQIAREGHPLKEVLESFEKLSEVPVVFDLTRIDEAQVEQLEKQVIKFPALKHVRFTTALRLIVKQLSKANQNELGFAYLIRPEFVELTTLQAARGEARRLSRSLGAPNEADVDEPASDCPRDLPLVSVEFSNWTLADALKQMAEDHAKSIVIDPRIGDKARAAVTATLFNVPFDTAVYVLADMTGLRSVPLDNVVYVTSPDNATRLVQSVEQFRKSPYFAGPIPALGGLLAPAPAASTTPAPAK